MLWSQLSIQTVREENHPLLVRAAYRRAGPRSQSEWLALGKCSIDKIERIIAHESNFGRALERCGVVAIPAGECYVVESQSGEATLARCSGYAELLERAVSNAQFPSVPDAEGAFEPEEFYTPGVKTIAQIAEFSGLPAKSQIKSLVMVADSEMILVLLRGDHQMSDWKFASATKADVIRPATAEEIRVKFGADAGSLGPVGISGIRILTDAVLQGRKNMISGANKNDYHLRNVTPGEDFEAEFVDLRLVMLGDTSLANGEPLEFVRVEIVRTAGDVLEAAAAQHQDADGLALPVAIAPFSVVITPVHPDRLEAARGIYNQLLGSGIDALLDDRDARPGVKFKDADLVGFPFRINVGKKFAEGLVEFVTRAPKASEDLPVSAALTRLSSL
jgi:prolyl-tRNA synthetase